MRLRNLPDVLLILLLLAIYNQDRHVSAYQAQGRSPSLKPKPYGDFVEGPVVKSLKRPVLTVIDPKTKSRIHLVGVCHGSASSANLVKQIFAEVNPAAVVLELCDDRFFSISLEAKIRPRGNDTQARIFDDEMDIMRKEEVKAKEQNGVLGALAQLNNVFGFVAQQGLVGGTFVLLSLCVNNLQRLFRFNTGDDEFVTAMIEAEKYNIPVRLGDAPQNDTLKSIKGIVSPEVFNPKKIVEGSLFLMFSALGLLSDKSYKPLSDRIPGPLLKASQWLSVPGAYLDDRSMLQTLIPIFAASIFTTSIGALYVGETVAGLESINDLTSASDTVGSALLPIQMTTSALMTYLSALIHNQVTLSGEISAISNSPWVASIGTFFEGLDSEGTLNNLANFISVLLIIRMSKLIGTDRDSIIAEKVQAAATEFPGQDIVVVIGMLHCNGVARWLLSGLDPLAFNSAQAKL